MLRPAAFFSCPRLPRLGLLGLLVVLVGTVFPPWSQADLQAQGTPSFKVIVHPDNPTSSLTRRQVSNFFLKKSRSWDHGPRAQPVDLPTSAAVRDPFSKAVLGRSSAAIKNHWAQSIFSGKASAPPELANEEAVVAFVAANPGAIGYVSANAATGSVKVIPVADL